MKITTFPPEQYRDCPMYYRMFLNHFEYLTVIKGQIYTGHMTIHASLVMRIKKFFHMVKSEYADNEMKAILRQLKLSAQTTIDFILDGGKK